MVSSRGSPPAACAPESLGGQPRPVGPACLRQRDPALRSGAERGEGRVSQASGPQREICVRMQICRLLETVESQIIRPRPKSPSQLAPRCAGDVMTMVALATAGRRGAAGCGDSLPWSAGSENPRALPGEPGGPPLLTVHRPLEKGSEFTGRRGLASTRPRCWVSEPPRKTS